MARSFTPPGCREVLAQISVFLCPGLALLEMDLATLQGESKEGKGQVCSRAQLEIWAVTNPGELWEHLNFPSWAAPGLGPGWDLPLLGMAGGR